MHARLCAIGTSVPPDRYTQEDLIAQLNLTDPRMRSLYLNGAIETRHLVLPPRNNDGQLVSETQGQLLEKHRAWGIRLAAEALSRCLAEIGASPIDVDYLCCVSSTGFLTPGLSARVMERLDMRSDCSRLDVVGMGCNAGLNALAPVAAWAETHPGRLAVMICVEACSAAYVFDGTMRTAVVNSLFGDGAAAVAVTTNPRFFGPTKAKIVKTSSHIVLESLDAMRYDWDDEQNLFSFYLDPHIPYVVGAHAGTALDRLLAGTALELIDIAHWLVHSGGKKVIDAIRLNLGLSRHDVRHTLSVLRDYGNVSSGSFLFSLERLISEHNIRSGDYGVMTTMGPGSSIEMALIEWE